MTECSTNDFATYGARLFKGALKPCMAELKAALADLPPDEVGVRIHGIEALRADFDRRESAGGFPRG